MHHFVDFWFSLKCDILHPIRMNESQLGYGLGSHSVLTNHISEHNRIMLSHLYNVSQFTSACPCVASVFLAKIPCPE